MFEKKSTQKFLAGTAAFAGVIALSNAALRTTNAEPNKHFDQIEKAAIKEANSAADLVIVLHEDVKYRTAPQTVNSDGPDNSPNTVAGTVGKGEVIRVDRPIMDQRDDGSTWLGFGLDSKEGQPVKAEPKKIYWVNFSQLEKEQTSSGSALFTIYDYSYNAAQGAGSQNLEVSIDSNKIFVGSINGHGGPVAEGQKISKAGFEKQAAAENLTIHPSDANLAPSV